MSEPVLLSPSLSDDSEDHRILSDIVQTLCAATSDDERRRLAAQLCSAVDAIKPSIDFFSSWEHQSHVEELSPAVIALNCNLQALLDSPNQSHRLAAIAAFTALIHTETESIHARVQRAANALRVLFTTHVTDLRTAQAASNMVSVLADVKSPIAARAVDHILRNAINIVGSRSLSNDSTHSLLSVDRARAAMVITELASINKAPKFVLRYQESLRHQLWNIIWDHQTSVREQGVQGLQAILETVVLRAEKHTSSTAMHQVLHTLREALLYMHHSSISEPTSFSIEDRGTLDCTDSTLRLSQHSEGGNSHPTHVPLAASFAPFAVIHGSLRLLKSLLSSDETRVYMKDLSLQICHASLQYQSHPNPKVRNAVAEILPKLVVFDHTKLTDSFVQRVHFSTMDLISKQSIPSSERGCSLVSLAEIWTKVGSSDNLHILRDILKVCRSTLQSPPCPTRIPLDAVLESISTLAGSCHGNPIFEKEIRSGLLSLIFNTRFTSLLISSVESIRNAVPSLDDFIRGSLINLIASTLIRGLPDKRTGMPSAFSSESLNNIGTEEKVSSGPGSRLMESQSFSHSSPVHRPMHMSIARPLDFFRQYSLSTELQHIDGIGRVASKSNLVPIGDLLLSDRLLQSESSIDYDSPGTSNSDPIRDIRDSPCVALKAILNYHFQGLKSQDLTTFVNEYVICYVESNSVKIRALAVAASAELMKSAAEVWSSTKRGGIIITRLEPEIYGILLQLVKVAVADPSKDVRFIAVRCLSSSVFRRYLLQTDILSVLALSLHDASLGVRDTALSLLCDLGRDNPAYILPVLRLYLTHLLTVLRCDGDHFSQRRQQATELISTLVHNALYFIKPYTGVLVEAFMSRIEEARNSLSTEDALPVLQSIVAMGGLSSLLDLDPFKEVVVPVIVSLIVDGQGVNNSFRIAALKALSAIALNTGFVVKPYVDHVSLLPRLLEILRAESDATVRLEVQALLGSLGAVDPEGHKYAALPNLLASNPVHHSARGSGSVTHGKSALRTESNLSRGSTQGSSSSHKPLSKVSSQSSLTQANASKKSSQADSQRQINPLMNRPTLLGNGNSSTTSELSFAKTELSDPSLSLFAFGEARLKKSILTYVPDWSRGELDYVFLVGRLEHPFTASADYFPSVLLDELQKLISNRKPRDYVREACNAIVKILMSVGPRCSYFLPAVVPRMLWLVRQLLTHESLESSLGFNKLQFVIQSLGDIVCTAGPGFLPYSFDTLLLILHYLRQFKTFPSAIVPLCELLNKLSSSLGNEFKPAVACLLPRLLAILAHGKGLRDSVVLAVLRTLESLYPLCEGHSDILLDDLTTFLTKEMATKTRVVVLTSLVRMLQSSRDVKVVPCIVLSLVQTLLGISEGGGNAGWSQSGSGSPEQTVIASKSFPTVREERSLVVLSAAALFEVGNRSYDGFEVFVPVISKAMKSSALKTFNPSMYEALRSLLSGFNSDVVRDILDDCAILVPNTHGTMTRSYDMNIHRTSRPLLSLPLDVNPPQVQPPSVVRPYFDQLSEGDNPHIVEETLLELWVVESHFEGDDWVRWLSDLRATMFQHSGCHVFRSCVRVSEVNPAFTKNLFNAAFLSCWVSLSGETKIAICERLVEAISSPTIPLNVLQSLLNLFEFMDHDEKPLSAPVQKLAETACRSGALAKALRYQEQSYCLSLSQELEESNHIDEDATGLIDLYEKLDHIESATGTISHYKQVTGIAVTGEWYEKLQQWDNALTVYQEMHATTEISAEEDAFGNKRKWEATLGILRCLNQGGQWRAMVPLLREARRGCAGNEEAIRQLAIDGKALSVTFDLGMWDDFEDWVNHINSDTYEGCFYNAVLHIKRRDPSGLILAQHFVDKARHHLDLELAARVSEGYPRAYSHVLRSQVLTELGEMVQYLHVPGPEAVNVKKRMMSAWDQRLLGCKRDRYTWYHVLMARTAVVKPIELKARWLEYAIMCRKAKLLPMASEALHILVMSYAETLSDQSKDSPSNPEKDLLQNFEIFNRRAVGAISDLELKFACIKHLWALNKRIEAYCALEECRDEFLKPSNTGLVEVKVNVATDMGGTKGDVLAGEVFSKLSKWGHRLRESNEVEPTSIADPLEYARKATEVRPDWYKAWHYWAVMNGARFEALMEKATKPSSRAKTMQTYRQSHKDSTEILMGPTERYYLSKAVTGYFRAIDLCGKSRLEDSLKVLTLWFRYGGYSNMHHEFNRGFEDTNITRWLEVVPQIIARLHTPYAVVQDGVKRLLTRIGLAHPHVAVYPLTVAKSTGNEHQGKRSKAARDILDELKEKHLEIVEQAELVARELVRVAVLWTEMWYEKLEEASKLFFVERDAEGMIDVLLPLHEEMERGARTVFEREFTVEHGRELFEAASLCRRYRDELKRGMDEESLEPYILQAWNLYGHVFRKIQKSQQGLQELNLAQVSYGLHQANELLLAVPGTYKPDGDASIVRIVAFSQQLNVIQSKQRPRKLSMVGSDGKEYQFLLKGHEDLRQDERVMQVFGLINKLFAKSDRRTLLHGVEMTTFSVVALSSNAGLIEWVPNCDTMHALVKSYRDARKIVPNIEQRVMVRCVQEPERLTLLQKVDLFEYMLNNTSGADLQRILWLKSRNSEMWLDRRTTYAKSLATTSMTGYLLGLGDRHPSNLMIERSSGKIMHIDFGDCFEVAMKRDKYPERVPFRLTRMLVEVLEPCGVEGFFQQTCLAAMEVIRQKNAKESMMSMMEAFVYDPLIRWKLVGAEELTQLKEEVDTVGGKGDGLVLSKGSSQGGNREGRLDRNRRTEAARTRENVTEIVRNLNETGSLAESVKRWEMRERKMEQTRRRLEEDINDVEVTSSAHRAGASSIAIIGEGIPRKDNEAPEEENTETLNYDARSRQRRAIEEAHRQGSHQRIAAVSNERAQMALDRIEDKLSGTDYDKGIVLSVEDQVQRLIDDARNVENLCTLFLGWCAFW